MGSWEIFIYEGPTVYGESSFSSRIGDISSLDDETIFDFVYFGIEVM